MDCGCNCPGSCTTVEDSIAETGESVTNTLQFSEVVTVGGTCPTCGRCPTCGQPYMMPVAPYHQYPTPWNPPYTVPAGPWNPPFIVSC